VYKPLEMRSKYILTYRLKKSRKFSRCHREEAEEKSRKFYKNTH
jgi:hypothetical protein